MKTETPIKIVVFGATGAVGSRVVTEAMERGHHVTAIVRGAKSLAALPEGIVGRVTNCDVPKDIADAMSGQDAAISALRGPKGAEGAVVGLTKSVLDGAALAKTRVVIVGGAARLRLPNGSPHSVLTDPGFLPLDIVPTARASFAQTEICQSTSNADWTYASPSALLAPGQRTGTFRIGTDTLLVDDNGRSEISMEDFAIALVDEAENGKFIRASFTVGY